MAELLRDLELWLYGAGMIFGLLLIGAAMLTDIERNTWNPFDLDDDPDDRGEERQEAELPLA